MSKFVQTTGFMKADGVTYRAYPNPMYLNTDYIVRFTFTTVDGKEAVSIDTSEPSGLRVDCNSISFDVDYFKQLAGKIDDKEPSVHHGMSFKKMSGKGLSVYEENTDTI